MIIKRCNNCGQLLTTSDQFCEECKALVEGFFIPGYIGNEVPETDNLVWSTYKEEVERLNKEYEEDIWNAAARFWPNQLSPRIVAARPSRVESFPNIDTFLAVAL